MSDPSQARPSAQSNTYLKPPPATSARHHPSSPHRVAASSSSSSSSAAGPPPPRPPLAIHPTTTIAETAVIHGTHQISIGAGTVIHPRARIFSFEGPVHIGDGCIISEKSTVGGAATTIPTAATASGASGTITTTRISSSVTIGPYAAVLPGAYVRSAAVIDALAVVNRHATVGAHSKVCSGCEIPEKTIVDDWTVVWAAGGGIGQRRRKRVVGAGSSPPPALTEGGGGEEGTTKGMEGSHRRPEGKRVEDARLIVLQKEREGLAKMIGLAASAQRRR
ncbi:hypothetical protein VTN77DRAFT_7596 [Rasamsonia byssochlamydoides]|uniref:uncharacterized protein n=1 Tax=Rasamsonia byssochlamydoides TaxID=89139 RepID=UPI0037431C0C